MNCLAASKTRAVRCLATQVASPDHVVPGKVALITGGNTGIGYQTAKGLAQKGYSIILGCRDEAKGKDAQRRLKAEVPQLSSVDLAVFDLADLASVQDYANSALDAGTRLDVLVNNAGVMACPLMRTRDGFEYQLGVNHLGHFLLTNMLLPALLRSEPHGEHARVVNVASAAHMFGTMNFGDLNYKNAGKYDRWRAYGQSKLANILFTRELARRLPVATSGVIFNTLHPGVVATELGRFLLPGGEEGVAWWQAPLVAAAKAFTLTPEQGARTSLYLASSPEAEGVSGQYFDSCKEAPSSRESKDAVIAARLWDASAELVGFEAPTPVVASRK